MVVCKAEDMNLSLPPRARNFSVLALGVVALFGCRRTSAEDLPAAHLQGAVTPAVAAAVSPPAAATALTAHGSPGATGPLAPFFDGLPARAAFDAGRHAEAADGFEAWIQAQPDHPDAHRARFLWHFSQHRAGRHLDAADGLEKLAAEGGLLADHERLWAAEAALAGGAARRALDLLAGIDETGFVRRERLWVLRAQAARVAGDKDTELGAWRALVRQADRRTGDVLLQAAIALDEAGDAAEAARLLRMIQVRFPGSRTEAKAVAALSHLPDDLRRLSIAEVGKRADLASRQHAREEALQSAAEVLSRAPKGSPAWCDAALIRARVTETFFKRRPEAVRFYDEAVAGCPITAASAPLWFRAALRHNNSGSAKRAMELFGRVRKHAPKSTLVDDAVRWQARIERTAGRHRKANAALSEVIDLQGDMVQYAAWDLVWYHYGRRDWAKAAAVAKAALDRGDGTAHLYNQGRFGYWLAMAESKRGAKGRKRAIAAWAEVVRAHPLTWYGWLSRRRLEAVAPKVAAQAWAASKKLRRVEDLLASSAALTGDPHVRAGIELMRLGLTSSSAAELRAVPWQQLSSNSGAAEPAMFQALLHHSVGNHSRATSLASSDRSFDAFWPEGENLQRWQLAYPRPAAYRKRVDAEARRQGIPAAFVWAIMRSESRFNPEIQSPVLATGLLQLMVPTGQKMASRLQVPGQIDHSRLKDPELNIQLGVGYMGVLAGQLANHLPLVASGYNAGPHNTEKWLKAKPSMQLDAFVEDIPFRENRRYVKSVMTSAVRYAFLYDDGRVPDLAWNLRPARKSR